MRQLLTAFWGGGEGGGVGGQSHVVAFMGWSTKAVVFTDIV